ncbi:MULTISPECIES: aminotransferase class V-fold PLP-dependent enzyme [unclassified Herbaspirillum]|uniref:aminotransferase class V-fold PLP-dependent enzyme n=1 Tax=unclassified Herbaspirillum TaxID=2624150 RepID=UPI00114D74EB|nr:MULTISPECIES: aminotransferase class V-fold PLP-dependent enzyme [unclassified Herbaspirillum]MBB5391017.1 cysteine desulfurase [Herbaspirillum sp. SJZ102]TQK13283.1 cysteine desulfurase [Herbaspirillum sp. SJZ130]TQK15287.1 cysteine desulfurase [Herbaspirillum sp. SJZ106]TWC62596.1 cysteine desulfurase [Herbaspirillum sp. SJZ099]
MNAPAPCRPPASLTFPIYLDYGATTPVDPQVARIMCDFLTDKFGNAASSSHPFGWEARRAVEKARAQVAGLLGAQPGEIVWTSGATESNNLAIKGTAQALAGKGRHLVTVATEHKAVLDTMHTLERAGFEVTFLQPGDNGLVTPQQFRAALRPDTILASVMYVNNEIGVIQPIAELGEICAERGIVFHVDAVQAAGKIPVDLARLTVDLMSVSAHKVYGPKGIGALYVRNRPDLKLQAQIDGGGHENGMRSGTLATHQIVGMGEAFELAGQLLAEESARIRALRDRLWAGIGHLPGVQLNGCAANRVPHNLNVSFPPTRYGTLASQLLGIAVSAGSACNSAAAAPSFVLLAIGRSPETARNAIRFSLGRGTTEAEIDYVIAAIGQVMALDVVADGA